MDRLEEAFYEVAFRSAFLTKKGAAFQDLFSEVMTRGYPNDFMRCRPWGAIGDRKNDGYLRSERMLFQVYAPNEMPEAECISKMETDFEGAIPHWELYFDKWVFVHNSLDGLGPTHISKILDLDKRYEKIDALEWGYTPLRNEFFKLDDSNKIAVIGGAGRAPTQFDLLAVQFVHLQHVLFDIARKPPTLEQDLRPVPASKLAVNELSQAVQVMLQEGMKRSHAVEDYFRSYPDPTLGEGLAETFKQEYLALREENLLPDEIYYSLHAFAGGMQQKSPTLEAAVLAVLAHFFEKCDIFERPIGED